MSISSDFFFYGTLCYKPLLTLVLGRELPRGSCVKDGFSGHSVCWAKDQIFPLLMTKDGASATGLRVRGLTDEDLARLAFYEGGFHFDLRSVVLASGVTARVFFPQDKAWIAGAAWKLEDWAQAHSQLTLLAAQEVMSYYGKRTAKDVAKMFPMIRNRAWSRILAEQSPKPKLRSPLSVDNLDIREKRRVYADFFALDEVDLRFAQFKGGMSPTVNRSIFIGVDAVMVLPYDPRRDRVLVIEQYRTGPYLRGNRYPWMIEPVAGIIDAGETPETTAKREVVEETGVVLHGLVPMQKYYPSPGATTEYFHNYIGLADLPDEAAGISGLESEAEDIRSIILEFDDFMQILESGEVETGPLLICGYWLALNRARLRAIT